MKGILTLILTMVLISESIEAQDVGFDKMTVVKMDYSLKTTWIDTTTYILNSQPTPLFRIESWMVIGGTLLPIYYSEDNPAWDKTILSGDTTIRKFRKTIKVKAYNELKKEWFVHERRKRTMNSRVILWITFFHEYHQSYFTEKTTMKFDKNGLLKEKITIEKHQKKLMSHELYYYE